MNSVLEKEIQKQKIKPPSMYNVIFLNDDFTSFEFVISCLVNIFGKNLEEAIKLTTSIHVEGKAIVAIYPKDIAMTKKIMTLEYAKQMNYPLQVEIEPIEK